MLLVILLALSIVAQLFAVIVALKLTRETKYNAAWILITIGLILTVFMMVEQLLVQLSKFTNNYISLRLDDTVMTWISVAIALCFAVGVFFIQRVLGYIFTQEETRRRNEERILNAVIQAEEAQRQQFAKELHDGLGPLLSTAKLSISALASKYGEMDISKQDMEIINNIQQSIALSINSIKDISNNLSPHVLNNFGVVRALNSFINRLRPAVETRIIFDTNLSDERFKPNNEIIIYRIACELITNALKHAKASRMIILLKYDKGMVNINVKDDGEGFDIENPSEGMGLSNISSRVSSVKGTIKIHSDSKWGTEIDILLPMSPTEMEK